MIKNLPYKEKLEHLKRILSNIETESSEEVLNIIYLCQTNGTCEDSFFQSESVWFNDITELVDTRSDLSKEIGSFIHELNKYFLSLFKSQGSLVTKETPMIPVLFQRVMLVSDFLSLGNNLKRSPNLSMVDVPTVSNAYPLLVSLSARTSISDNFLNEFLKNANVSGSN